MNAAICFFPTAGRTKATLRTYLSSLVTAGLLATWVRTEAAQEPTTNAQFAVNITVDAAQATDELKPIWRFFGADEANYAYMKDGKKLLSELGQLGGAQVYFRAHHLLTSGDGAYALKFGSTSAYKEDPNGAPVYDWSINDKIFDTYLERGIKPYVEIGFMPKALSTHPQDYPDHPKVNERVLPVGGETYPPKDYAKWGELIYQWTRHCVEKYGAAEVQQWYWEVWNEPNISYWHDTPAAYFKLYDYAVDGVRRALPGARVGGPETAGGTGGNFLRSFLEHCARETNYVTGGRGAPLDFISFHAKGAPVFTNAHVRMGVAHELKASSQAFGLIATFPEFKRLPIIIGEFDPDGGAAFRKPYAVYRTGTIYASYTAESFARVLDLARNQDVNLEGALTWAFEFEDQPLFANFRVLASQGLGLPVFNVFRMFSKMSGRRIAVQSSAAIPLDRLVKEGVRESADVSGLASLDGHKLMMMLWHYHDDDLPGPAAAINLKILGLPVRRGSAKVRHYRIDEKHSNAFAAWKAMGQPAELTGAQYKQLERAGQLEELAGQAVEIKKGMAALEVDLPLQAVSLLVLEW